jgi:hypothetical protein
MSAAGGSCRSGLTGRATRVAHFAIDGTRQARRRGGSIAASGTRRSAREFGAIGRAEMHPSAAESSPLPCALAGTES